MANAGHARRRGNEAQPHQGTSTADDKDALEARIHRLVCGRKVPLAEAQQAMRTDWVSAYRKYISRRSQARHAGME